MSLFPDLIDLFQVFDAEGVEYLLVGGHAVALHGRPRFTKDADLWVRDTPDNFERLARALDAFGAPPGLAAKLASAAPEDVVWMGFPPTGIDLVKWVPGGDFDEAWADHETRSVEGAKVRLVSRARLGLTNLPTAPSHGRRDLQLDRREPGDDFLGSTTDIRVAFRDGLPAPAWKRQAPISHQRQAFSFPPQPRAGTIGRARSRVGGVPRARSERSRRRAG